MFGFLFSRNFSKIIIFLRIVSVEIRLYKSDKLSEKLEIKRMILCKLHSYLRKNFLKSGINSHQLSLNNPKMKVRKLVLLF